MESFKAYLPSKWQNMAKHQPENRKLAYSSGLLSQFILHCRACPERPWFSCRTKLRLRMQTRTVFGNDAPGIAPGPFAGAMEVATILSIWILYNDARPAKAAKVEKEAQHFSEKPSWQKKDTSAKDRTKQSLEHDIMNRKRHKGSWGKYRWLCWLCWSYTDWGSVCTSRLYTMPLVASSGFSKPKFACSHKLLKLREDLDTGCRGGGPWCTHSTCGRSKSFPGTFRTIWRSTESHDAFKDRSTVWTKYTKRNT